MKYIFKKYLSGGTVLLISIMLVNAINFMFNAYLGRVLTFEEFGLVTLVNTFLYITIVLFTALYMTVNHKVAYLSGKGAMHSGKPFLAQTNKQVLLVSLGISVLWLISIPFLDQFFQINDFLVPFFFTPIITLGALTATNKGFLQGIFNFKSVAVIIIAEAISKLLFAWLFVSAHLTTLVYVVIPLSVLFAFLLSLLMIGREKSTGKTSQDMVNFPKKFFLAFIITGLSSTAFLTFDLLLAKHFLPPVEAGQYALLSLIGKMVYFFGTLPNALMVTFVSKDEGSNRDSRFSFYKLFAIAATFSILAFVVIALFGKILIPFLFGDKIMVILPYVTTYAAGIALFAMSLIIVSYHLAKRQYLFPVCAIFAAVLMSTGIMLFHANIEQITHVIFYTSLMSFIIITFFHVLEMYTNISLTERISTAS